MKVIYTHKLQRTPRIFSFFFKPEHNVHYIPGQFIELYLPHPNKDMRGEKRWFTLSSSPREAELYITTNFAVENGSTFKDALRELEPGTELKMASPMGDFVLPKDPSIPLVFVAGGIGCTPYHSIIKDLQLSGDSRDIILLYAANKLEDVAFREVFDKLGNKFKIVLKNPGPDWDGNVGQLDANMIKELGSVTGEHYIYLSGPEPMIESLYKELKSSGFNKRHIYTDYFPNYLPI